jgi:hypothetical protein
MSHESWPQPLSYNPHEPMPAQTADWTCSACSLAWINRALGIDIATDEWTAVEYIGNPENINAMYGLMDASGSVLVDCLRQNGAPAFGSWPTWDAVMTWAAHWPLLIGGVQWNHWVGVRTRGDDWLELANSAPSWCGIGDRLYIAEWYDLGPFAVVAVPLLRNLPPPPTA